MWIRKNRLGAASWVTVVEITNVVVGLLAGMEIGAWPNVEITALDGPAMVMRPEPATGIAPKSMRRAVVFMPRRVPVIPRSFPGHPVTPGDMVTRSSGTSPNRQANFVSSPAIPMPVPGGPIVIGTTLR